MTSPDAELLRRWRDGDRESGRELFERYYDVVERFFANKVTSGVGDLVQETFMACVEGKGRVSDESKFRSYLFSIAYNVLRGYLRRKSRSHRAIDYDRVSVHDVCPGPGTLMGQRREQRLLLAGLRHIPLAYQTILELHYWENMTTAAIAEVEGMPVGTVRSRLRRARELLEEAMDRLSGSVDELESTMSRLDDWARECRELLR